MEATWEIIINIILTIVILLVTIVIIANYLKHKDDESISPDNLKRLRRSHFFFAMLVAVWLLIDHISRFFN